MVSSLMVFADDWGRHPSSCQHLVRRLRKHYRVLWVNTIGTRQVRANSLTFRRGLEKLRNWSKGTKQVDEQMWTIDLPMLPGLSNPLLRQLNRFLVTHRLRRILARLGMSSPLILTTLPYIGWLIGDLPRQALVYYCTDDYSHWPSADRLTLQQADRELSQQADLILAVSQALLASHQEKGSCQFFPHGVDIDHFSNGWGNYPLPPVLQQVPGPRLGYFGLIYEKLDFELLTALAHQFPQASLVMIGPKAYCPPHFASLPNVHCLGPQPYEELPHLLAGLDVLLLPYVNDEMIRQSSPLKLRECLATGKPTVSVDVPEVRVFQPHVRVAGSRDEFIHQVRLALEEPGISPLKEARKQAVRGDSWDSRARWLESCFAQLESRNRPHPTCPHTAGRFSLPKVLHLRTISGKGGGPEKTILNSPRFLEGKYTLRVAYIRPGDDPQFDIPEKAARLGVDLVDLPEWGPVDLRTVWRLAQEIKDFQPDILHAHDYKTNILAALLGRWFRIPTMTTLHGYVSRGGRLEMYYSLDRWALRKMDHIITVSEDLFRHVADLNIPLEKCTLIENAIDTLSYSRTQSIEEAKRKMGLNPNRLVIGAVGRLAREKGFDLLIQAVHQLWQVGLKADLILVGDGDQKLQLENLIRELDATDYIHLLGYRTDTLELYQGMDVFVLSSLREGLPNVVLEAMALEVPVIATRIAGVPRVITHEENGLLVEPDSKEELVQALSQMVKDESLRKRLGKAGRETVEKRFSFSNRMKKVQGVYGALLKRKKSSCLS